MEDPPYTSSHFHDDIHKQIVSTATASLSEAKLQWAQVAPFLSAARALCSDDIRLNARLTLHGQEYEGDQLIDAEEAFLSMSVRDREDGLEWLQATWWLSDIALSDEDPARVREIIGAVEKSLDKLRAWLTEREAAAESPSLDKGEA